MSLSSKILSGAALLLAVSVIGIKWNTIQHVAQQNKELREQLAALRGATGVEYTNDHNQGLSNEQHLELLGLRGQIGVLRQETREAAQLRRENERLHTNWVNQLLNGTNLTVAQIGPYLKAKNRDAMSLLTAARLTGQDSFLQEAIAKEPNNPRVAFTALFKSQSAEERRKWLDVLKQTAPENGLANYLSAEVYFKSGQPQQALEELAAASTKPVFDSYAGIFSEASEEAYQQAGCYSSEAKILSVVGLPMPQLRDLRNLGQSLEKLATQYRQSGNPASAQATIEMGTSLARRLSEPSPQDSIIQNLVGIAVETKLLAQLEPNQLYDNSGKTVQARLDELTQRRKNIKDSAGSGFITVFESLSEPERLAFFEEYKRSGEMAALRWAQEHTKSK